MTTDRDLAAVCAHMRGQDFCALDVEFVWRKTYFPAIALIQMASSDGRVALVDPLAIDDPSPLAELLDDTSVLKVLHSGSQDLMVFQQYLGTVPRPLVDSQIAAAMVGLGYSMGYAALVQETQGVTLPKGAQTSDWLRRPLSQRQLDYGANEVSHLVAAWRWLRDELEARGRLDWAMADSAATIDAALTSKDPVSTVSGAGRLKPQQLTVLHHLALWRDGRAKSSDRPVRWIAEDAALMEIATKLPESAKDLRRLDLPDYLKNRQAGDLIHAVRTGLDTPKSEWIHMPRRRKPTPSERKRAGDLLARIRALATANDIPPELIAPRRQVEALAFEPDQPDHPLLTGWRGELLRDQILPILVGNSDTDD